MIYAIGDIHGRYDLFDQALSAIAEHASGRASQLVFLGDYIDRGGQSREVVERLMELEREGDVICLKGNHEQLAVHAHYFDAWDQWLGSGGEETLVSFGGAIPAMHLEWLDGLRHHHTVGYRHFVHAGVDPARLAEPAAPDCMWIRERFLKAPPEWFAPWHIVHGHTPIWNEKPVASEPELKTHRTNLDTGAYDTGVLAVGVFSGDRGGPDDVLFVRT